MTDEAPLVSLSRSGGVATVTMQRPPANALTPEFIAEVAAAVETAGADPATRVIVLRSALERIFVAGADIANMASRISGAPEVAQVGVLGEHLLTIERVEKPTIAAISGHALGGGCELALVCDYRLMVDDGRASIGQTETALGLLPGAGGTQRLPRLVGWGRALHLIMEGRRLRAPEALAIGLVDAIHPPEEFAAAVTDKAEQLAAMATRALGLVKRVLREASEDGLQAGLAAERRAFTEVLRSADIREGVGAFLEKRPPSFTGR